MLTTCWAIWAFASVLASAAGLTSFDQSSEINHRAMQTKIDDRGQ